MKVKQVVKDYWLLIIIGSLIIASPFVIMWLIPVYYSPEIHELPEENIG